MPANEIAFLVRLYEGFGLGKVERLAKWADRI